MAKFFPETEQHSLNNLPTINCKLLSKQKTSLLKNVTSDSIFVVHRESIRQRTFLKLVNKVLVYYIRFKLSFPK